MGIELDMKYYQTTYTEASRTTMGKSLIHSKELVYNFDAIKREVLEQLGLIEEGYKSCESLLKEKGASVLVEFKNIDRVSLSEHEKNGKDRYKCNTLKSKALHSKLILQILKENSYLSAKKDILYVVYKEDKGESQERLEKQEVEEIYPSIVNTFKNVGQDPKKEIIAFGLDKMEGTVYKEVHTCSELEFKQTFGI